MDAFRAYKKAFLANDLPEAERQAVLALAAAEAQSSPKRGLLAINLASVRYEAGKFAEAKAAAAQAREAIAAGAEGDAWAARLIELQAGVGLKEMGAARALATFLAKAGEPNAQNAPELFDAAMTFGGAMVEKKDWDVAVQAFQMAVQTAKPEFGVSNVERAQALIGLGAAEVLQSHYVAADEPLREAVALTASMAMESEGPVANSGERLYATALAWRSALQSAAMSDTGKRLPSDSINEPSVIRPQLPDNPPLCKVDWKNASQKLSFPSKGLNNETVGAVVLRMKISADGRILAAEPLVVVPTEQGFDKAALAAVLGVQVSRKSDSPEPCRLQTDSFLLSIAFALRN